MAGILLLGQATAPNGGNAQVNVDFGSGYNDLWAIDQVKQSQGFFPVSLGSDAAWASRINDDGYPTSMPSGTNWRLSECYINGLAGDVWVLEWTGTTTITMAANFAGGGLSSSVISANRIEYTITGSPVSTNTFGGVAGGPLKVTVDITALTSFSNLRIYPKILESFLNGTGATSIFHPSFLSKAQPIGAIRFLNWTQANYSKSMKWEYMRSESNLSWMGPKIAASLFYGSATKGSGNNVYTCPTSFGSLVNGQAIQMTWPARPTFTAVLAADVTKGATTAFHIVGHTFTNGDLVSFEQSFEGGATWSAVTAAKSLVTGLPPSYTVTVTDADNITINLNSSGFSAPSGTLNLYPRIQISDGVTTKIAYRQGFVNTINSEWSGHTYPGTVLTAVYHSEFDCFTLGGDNNEQQLLMSSPVTAMITLCNYCGAHPWFVFPYISEDNFWTQLATTVKARLTSGLVPRFESGNEIWNTGSSFYQTAVAESVAAKNYAQAAGVTAQNYGYAKRFVEVKALIEAVYGTGSNWQMILGCQLGGVVTSRLQGPAALNGGDSANYPGNKADYIAVAPYVSTTFMRSGNAMSGYPGALDQIDNYNQGGASRTTALDWWLAEMQTPSTPAYGVGDASSLDYMIGLMNGYDATLAAYTGRRGTGLKKTHYEGGPTQATVSGISASGFPANAPISGRSVTRSDAQNFFGSFLNSSQSGTFMTAYLTQMAAANIEFPSQFTLSSTWNIDPAVSLPNNSGMWNNSNYASSASPMYTAFINWNNL